MVGYRQDGGEVDGEREREREKKAEKLSRHKKVG